jgi:hypothetical protein
MLFADVMMSGQSVALPSAQASPPVLFERRRVRRFPFSFP